MRGPVPAAELGFTLPHEHIYCRLQQADYRYAGGDQFDDDDVLAAEVEAFAALGGGAVFDLSAPPTVPAPPGGGYTPPTVPVPPGGGYTPPTVPPPPGGGYTPPTVPPPPGGGYTPPTVPVPPGGGYTPPTVPVPPGGGYTPPTVPSAR